MDRNEALKWLQRLASVRRAGGVASDGSKYVAWMVEAEALFSRVFIPSEPVLLRLRAAIDTYTRGGRGEGGMHRVHAVIGAFDACSSVLENAPMADLFWKVQVAGSGELLEQADELVSSSRSLAAAAVLAGGALEQHLRHLCQRYSLHWTGNPSIAAYNNAVRAAKSTQAVPYEEADAKQVEAWAAIRNEAGHTPGAFRRDRGDVARMIDGVRSFLARTQ